MYDTDDPKRTIGVLYPGEMGAATARALRTAGHRVVTSVDGRGSQTRERTADAGLQILDDLPAVVAASDLIISLVPPAAALSIAQRVAACPHRRPSAIYIDANSISPLTARQIAELVEPRGFRFVDAAIHGPANRLADLGRIYLSGPDAADVANLFDGVVEVRLLGDEPGRASAMKMLLGGMVKGMAALFIELSVAGHNAGLLEDFIATFTEAYPGIMTLIRRTLPTYPRHAARRKDELHELETTMRSLGVKPQLVAAARRSIDRLAESDLREYVQAIDDGLFDLDDLVELFSLHLSAPAEVPSESTNELCHV